MRDVEKQQQFDAMSGGAIGQYCVEQSLVVPELEHLIPAVDAAPDDFDRRTSALRDSLTHFAVKRAVIAALPGSVTTVTSFAPAARVIGSWAAIRFSPAGASATSRLSVP